MEHDLKTYFQQGNGNDMTNDEFVEFENLTSFYKYMDDELYEYNGNHIISKDSSVVYNRVRNMCCGIINESVQLSNGEYVYFAFDFGH